MATPVLHIRTATSGDLPQLLDLLPQISRSPERLVAKVPQRHKAERILEDILTSEHIHLVVAERESDLVGALTLVIVPNLTYNGRPWSIIENVVVARGHRRRGIGKQLMSFAFKLAEGQGCYKVQLLSGPNENQVGFYRSLGMQDGTSRGFKMYFVQR